MDKNKPTTQRNLDSGTPQSIAFFSIELMSNGNIKYHRMISEENLYKDKMNAKYLAIIVHGLLKTTFGIHIYNHIIELLDISEDSRAQEFKYLFAEELNSLIKKEQVCVPASMVFAQS